MYNNNYNYNCDIKNIFNFLLNIHTYMKYTYIYLFFIYKNKYMIRYPKFYSINSTKFKVRCKIELMQINSKRQKTM